MKKIVSILLLFALICSLASFALAASPEAGNSADVLYALGLFRGTGVNSDGSPIYELDREPTCNEAVTMLVRLLGKESAAKVGNWIIPFTDVEEWAKPYVGYAYQNNLTNGTSGTTFSGSQKVTASQYLTFVLRALGYNSDTDFKWNAAWEFSDKIGLTNGEYNASSSFMRGDVARISASALKTGLKAQTNTLADKLITEGVFTLEQYQNVLKMGSAEPVSNNEEYGTQTTNGLRPEFKEAMDSYEKFYDKYCEFMKKYKKNPTDLSLLMKYTEMLGQAEEVERKFKQWDSSTLNSAELQYYTEVCNRVLRKLSSL